MKRAVALRSFLILSLWLVLVLGLGSPARAWALDESGENGDQETTAATAATSGTATIHVMAINDNDAILIESEGHFGIVDSGEDSTYPDGSDPRYPVRPGISGAGASVENRVIPYLESMGVTSDNLDFYIGTHPHSDHIGSAAQVIGRFKPKRIYTPRYSDSYISTPARLWDNLYVYDRLINAAQAAEREYGAQLIQDFDESNSGFALGSAWIELFNTGTAYQTTPVVDANCFSLGVKVTAGGHTAFLSGDINNIYGEEDLLARTLGHIDFLKLGHHGWSRSNTPGYLRAILSSSSMVFQTGRPFLMPQETVEALRGIGVRFACADDLMAAGKQAFVVTLSSAGVTNNYGFPPHAYWLSGSQGYGSIQPVAGWQRVDDGWLWFDRGYTPRHSSWVDLRGTWYYLQENGLMATGWLNLGGTWYYLDASGAMVTGWLRLGDTWYYLTSSGAMATGWLKLGNTWYYLDSSGAMLTGWLKQGSTWYYLTGSGAMATGWQRVGDSWYYFYDFGAMAANTRIGSYYVDASGRWVA